MLGPLDVPRDRKGNIKATRSTYQPSEKVKARTQQVHKHFSDGYEIMHKQRNEFNGRNVIEYQNDAQRAFNSYVPPRSEDPDESWRAQTVRPITRNKLISIAAHITSTVVVPRVFAQNEEDDADEDASAVLSNMVDYVSENSNYERKFFNSVLAALVNPAVILHAEFAEVMRTVKRMQKDGSYTQEMILDELLSGFRTNVVPVDEFYITNIYEPNVQLQPAVMWRRVISYDEAAARFHDRENFEHVSPNMQLIFVPEESTFYEQWDDDLPEGKIEWFTYYNRGADLELNYVNGVLMDDPDRPLQRFDKRYPFAVSGYEPVDEGRFFYYKSAADKIGPDQDLVDTLYNMVLDGTFLSLMPPMATFGKEQLDSSIYVPGTTVSFNDPEQRVESISPKSDLRSGLSMLGEVERSITESTADPRMQGIAQGGGEQTAYEVSRLETNSRVALGLFGKMISFLVEDFGQLMVGDILQHMTVAQGFEVQGEETKLKFGKFVLPKNEERGETRQIEFTTQLQDSFEILEREEASNDNRKIYQVNPNILKNIRYKVKVNPDALFKENQSLRKALNLEAYDRMIQNPLMDQEVVTRELLAETFKPGESNKFMKDKDLAGQIAAQSEGEEGTGAAAGNRGGTVEQKGVNDNVVSQITGNNTLSNAQTAQSL